MSSTIETVRQRYNDIITQNSDISQQIASSINMEDLGEDTQDLVATALLDIELECRRKTMTDRVISLLPSPVENRFISTRNNVERMKLKASNVAAVATKHFDLLLAKRDAVKSNILSLYSIQEKLTQSRSLLLQLRTELEHSINDLDGDGTYEARKELLIGKELRVQIESQIAVQNDLLNQLEMVDFTADAVLETINQTLPDIKANFIDQVSITAALNNLKNFKDSVDNTRKMTISLQEETFINTKNIMMAIADQGVGLGESEVLRLENLHREKDKLGIAVSKKLIENSKKLDSHYQRIRNLNDNHRGTFEQVMIGNSNKTPNVTLSHSHPPEDE